MVVLQNSSDAIRTWLEFIHAHHFCFGKSWSKILLHWKNIYYPLIYSWHKTNMPAQDTAIWYIQYDIIECNLGLGIYGTSFKLYMFVLLAYDLSILTIWYSLLMLDNQRIELKVYSEPTFRGHITVSSACENVKRRKANWF